VCSEARATVYGYIQGDGHSEAFSNCVLTELKKHTREHVRVRRVQFRIIAASFARARDQVSVSPRPSFDGEKMGYG
jgi:hypothetical protein